MRKPRRPVPKGADEISIRGTGLSVIADEPQPSPADGVHDLGDLRRMVDALRDERDLLVSVVNSCADPIFVKGVDGRHVFVNTSFGNVYGKPPAYFAGRCDAEFMPGTLAAAIRESDLHVMLSVAPVTVDRIVAEAGGAPREFVVTKTRWRRLGTLAGVVGVAREVTASRAAERRMREREAGVWHSARVVALGEAAAAMAHDLAHPLTAAASYVRGIGIALDAPGPFDRGKILKALERGLAAIVRSSDIVSGLRRMLRKQPGLRQPFDVNAAVREAVALGAIGFDQRPGARLVCDLGEHLPRVMADRTELQQVVMNLVRNAVQVMDRDGLEARQLVVSTAGAGDSVAITISDTGPGLPAMIAENLFVPFLTTRRDGVGLGLSICRSITEAHGGQISVTSGVGGTTAAVRLPALRTTGRTEDA